MAQFTINLSLSFCTQDENEEEEIFDNASEKPKGLKLSGERESEIICCQSVLPLHFSSYLFKSSNETEIYFYSLLLSEVVQKVQEKRKRIFRKKINIFYGRSCFILYKLNEIESFNIFLSFRS